MPDYNPCGASRGGFSSSGSQVSSVTRRKLLCIMCLVYQLGSAREHERLFIIALMNSCSSSALRAYDDRKLQVRKGAR